MKEFLSKVSRAAALALALVFAMALPESAPAQVVTQLPLFVTAATALDLGSGPIELRIVQGSAMLNTSSGSGIGSTSGSSTTLTLTAVPTTNPCIGCTISGAGITSGTTVTAVNGATLTLSAAMTVAASTPLAWGAVCPITSTGPTVPMQANVGADLPFYTQAHVCAYATNAPGAAILPFPIGAH